MKIAVINESLGVSQRDLARWLCAIEYQVKHHYAPAWALSAELRLLPRGKVADQQEFKIIFRDEPPTPEDAGYYGYHALDEMGKPMAYVFNEIVRSDGKRPSVVLSHEILEMIGDPWLWLTAPTPKQRFDFCSVEMCDPVQELEYDIDGVWVSDFILPAYLMPGQPGPYDYLAEVKRPFQVLHGGYLIVWRSLDGKRGQWTEKSATGLLTGKKHAFSRTRRLLSSERTKL